MSAMFSEYLFTPTISILESIMGPALFVSSSKLPSLSEPSLSPSSSLSSPERSPDSSTESPKTEEVNVYPLKSESISLSNFETRMVSFSMPIGARTDSQIKSIRFVRIQTLLIEWLDCLALHSSGIRNCPQVPAMAEKTLVFHRFGFVRALAAIFGLLNWMRRWSPPKYFIKKSENFSSTIMLWVFGALSSERSSVMIKDSDCSEGGGGRMGLISNSCGGVSLSMAT
ncbi:hypothetical protein Tco_0179666 [Tanacetum coccineum]